MKQVPHRVVRAPLRPMSSIHGEVGSRLSVNVSGLDFLIIVIFVIVIHD